MRWSILFTNPGLFLSRVMHAVRTNPLLLRLSAALRRVTRPISRRWHALPRATAILILDWLIFVAIVILVVVIYVPQNIWAEEDAYRLESRRRMEIVQAAERYYYKLRGHYATEGDTLFMLVSQAHDSLIADSTFIGNQIIHVAGVPFRVNLPEFMDREMDTTFSVGRLLRRVASDTTYGVRLWNVERADHDSLYVSGSAALAQMRANDAFRGVLDSTYTTRSEVFADYDWHRFRLEPKLLFGPVTGELYDLRIDSATAELIIASPITDVYEESRYLFFKFSARGHGKIVGDDPSWRRR